MKHNRHIKPRLTAADAAGRVLFFAGFSAFVFWGMGVAFHRLEVRGCATSSPQQYTALHCEEVR